MSEMPTPKQALLLWCVLGRQGTAMQSTLVPKVEKADREALVAGRYLSAEKQGNAFKLTVTDKGWNWAGGHLRDPLPASFGVLHDWLERIDRHLAATGETLADLIGSPPEQPVAAAKRLSARQLRTRIEKAYLALTGGRKAQSIRLSALRAQLADLDRATVDAGLAAILRGDKTAGLSQFSDPRSLDAAEHEAAYSPAGEPFHIIWIQS